MIEIGVLVVSLGVLAALLARQRGLLGPSNGDVRQSTWPEAPLALAVLVFANWELVTTFVTGPFLPAGDLKSHAMIAWEIALGHAHGGYVDIYQGGFPIGPHYPFIGWLLAAALMWCGMPPGVAVLRLAIGALLLFNGLVYLLSRRAGASFGAALAGAVLVSVISPITAFIGGAQGALVLGLLTQTVVLPAVALHAYQVVFGRSRRGLAFTAALVVLSHPQVAVALSALLAVSAAFRGAVAVRRWLFATVVQAIVGGAVFGPGIRSLHVPFGWPPMEHWRVIGRSPGVFLSWFGNGYAFDFGRDPVVTTAVAGALVVLMASITRRDSRAALGIALSAVALCLAGTLLEKAGPLGALLLSFLQPLRAYSLVPGVAATLVVVAVNRAEATLRSRPRLALAPPALAIVWLAHASAPDTWSEWHRMEARLNAPGCTTFDSSALDGLLTHLGEGRLFYLDKLDCGCTEKMILDFARTVPVAWPVAAGAHVGVLWDAMRKLDPTSAGADERADVLGIGTVLHCPSDPPQPEGAFREQGRVGALIASERVPRASYFGLGCVVRKWQGSDAALRTALFEAIRVKDPEVWSPTRFVALETVKAADVTRTTVTSPCDATRAVLTASQREAPGTYTASVRAQAPVDLVLKETAYPTWRIEVDGAATPFRLVAPGFMAVRLTPGDHHIVARVTWDLRYWGGVGASLAAVVVFTWLARRRLQM